MCVFFYNFLYIKHSLYIYTYISGGRFDCDLQPLKKSHKKNTGGFGWVPYKGLMWFSRTQPQTACMHYSTNNYCNTAFYIKSYLLLLYLLFFSFMVFIVCVCFNVNTLWNSTLAHAADGPGLLLQCCRMLDYIIFDSKNVPGSILFTEMYKRVWGEKSRGKDFFFPK